MIVVILSKFDDGLVCEVISNNDQSLSPLGGGIGKKLTYHTQQGHPPKIEKKVLFWTAYP